MKRGKKTSCHHSNLIKAFFFLSFSSIKNFSYPFQWYTGVSCTDSLEPIIKFSGISWAICQTQPSLKIRYTNFNKLFEDKTHFMKLYYYLCFWSYSRLMHSRGGHVTRCFFLTPAQGPHADHLKQPWQQHPRHGNRHPGSWRAGCQTLPALNLSCWPFLLFIKGVDDFGEDELEKIDNFFYFLIWSLIVYQNCTRTYTVHANIHIF